MVGVVGFGEFAAEGEFELGGGVGREVEGVFVFSGDIDGAVGGIGEVGVEVDIVPGDGAVVLEFSKDRDGMIVFRFAEGNVGVGDGDLVGEVREVFATFQKVGEESGVCDECDDEGDGDGESACGRVVEDEGGAVLELMAVGAFAGGFRDFAATHGAGFVGHGDRVDRGVNEWKYKGAFDL